MNKYYLSYTISRTAVAFVWLYHGLFPKLLDLAQGELAMNMALGFTKEQAITIAYVADVAEVVFGLLLIVLCR